MRKPFDWKRNPKVWIYLAICAALVLGAIAWILLHPVECLESKMGPAGFGECTKWG